MSSWPLNGKKGGNRKHSKIDTLPPEMKATVEEMIMDGSATYSDIVTYLEQQGYSLSVSSVCRYAQGYVENLQTLQIAQANFRNMLDELERYPDLDTTEALVRVASQNLMTALTSKKDEDWSAVSVDKLMTQPVMPTCSVRLIPLCGSFGSFSAPCSVSGKTSGSSHTRSRTGLASTTRRICGPIRTRICRGIGCRDITLSPKSHPKEVAPAPMKRRTIATQTTQTKEITYA